MGADADARDERAAAIKAALPAYFDALDEARLAALAEDMAILELRAGDVLCRQGEPSGDLYFVLSGRFRATRMEGGAPVTLGEIARGETIGELALFTGEPRSASVVATRPSRVAKLTREGFERVLAASPGVALAMGRVMIERFRRGAAAPASRARAATICLAATSPGLDARAFAEALAPHLPGRVGVMGRGEGSHDALDRAEAEHDTLILIGAADDAGWTRRAANAADVLLFVEDADESARLDAIETALAFDEHDPIVARRALALLHDPAKRSPRDTRLRLSGRQIDEHHHLKRGSRDDLARLGRALSGRAVGLVLSGGGARGFAHVGATLALQEAGIALDRFGGASMGGVAAAYPACGLAGRGLVEALRATFASSPTSDLNWLPITALLRGAKARRACEEMVARCNGAMIEIEDCWRPLFLIAADMTSNAEATLTSGDLSRALRATFAIPGLFPPVPIGGRLMVDGAVCNNFPVDVMTRLGAGAIVGSDVLEESVGRYPFDELPSPWRMLADLARTRGRARRATPDVIDILAKATLLGSASRQRELQARVDLLLRPDARAWHHLDWSAFEAIVATGRETTLRAIEAADPALIARLSA